MSINANKIQAATKQTNYINLFHFYWAEPIEMFRFTISQLYKYLNYTLFAMLC